MIHVVRTPSELRDARVELGAGGRRVALVPTMGYLHQGHVSLLEQAHRHADRVVLSIFVNPMQFGPSEDLARYPRDLDGDLDKAARAGAQVAFVPEVETIYPPGFQTRVEVTELQKGLCGARRPGHFAGVATVVLKLFHLVRPHVALFGEKDYQQLQLIRKMVRDLHVGVEIVGCPIVREPDGLALSSRNSYLSPAERTEALALSRALCAAREAFAAGARDAGRIVAAARAVLDAAPGVRLDYLELCDAEDLHPIDGAVTRKALLAVAAFVGATRLIDNTILA